MDEKEYDEARIGDMVAYLCSGYEEGQGEAVAGVSDYSICVRCLRVVWSVDRDGLCEICAQEDFDCDVIAEGVSD
jgi:hypothetical protein